MVFLIYPAYFYPNADTRLSGKKLRTANIFWTEDEGELHKIERKLIKANEITASSNELIRAENEIKEEKARVDFHNRTFEKIAEHIHPAQTRAIKYATQISTSAEDFREESARVLVI